MIVQTFGVHVGPGFDSRHLHHSTRAFAAQKALAHGQNACGASAILLRYARRMTLSEPQRVEGPFIVLFHDNIERQFALTAEDLLNPIFRSIVDSLLNILLDE